ncbi:hypothetical protein DL89DRAFT_281192 [Linderina pennispora]|uniref:Uncharacterized protein n=1 Tax=Linderina pennispora TaxID=61395 RepID=A0A1Y1WNR9_9FUNG|nr:uncharacterized protein DL89DRAFT_281192 [Linderina pennispora]ORX74876.1 hypothetical protein DL89DRAFT_281192 [Linderina pennispora]
MSAAHSEALSLSRCLTMHKSPGEVTDDTLLRHVQASRKLCRRVLAEIPAFRESGYWPLARARCWLLYGATADLYWPRRLSVGGHGTKLTRKWSSVRYAANQATSSCCLKRFDAVLARFGTCSAPAVYTIDGTKVAKYLAEQIFVAEQMRPWPAAEFLKAMHAAMPPHLTEFIGAPEHWSSKSVPDSIVREMAYVTAGAESQMLHTTHGVTYRSVTLNPLFRSALPHEPRVRMQKAV